MLKLSSVLWSFVVFSPTPVGGSVFGSCWGFFLNWKVWACIIHSLPWGNCITTALHCPEGTAVDGDCCSWHVFWLLCNNTRLFTFALTPRSAHSCLFSCIHHEWTRGQTSSQEKLASLPLNFGIFHEVGDEFEERWVPVRWFYYSICIGSTSISFLMSNFSCCLIMQAHQI